MIYIASVERRLPGAYGSRPPGDYAWVGPYCDDKPLTVTNQLRHLPPVENNISTYGGSFPSEFEARKAIRASFPNAVIENFSAEAWS